MVIKPQIVHLRNGVTIAATGKTLCVCANGATHELLLSPAGDVLSIRYKPSLPEPDERAIT